MTQLELEQAIEKTLEEILHYKAIWRETGDEAARKKMKEMQTLQHWNIDQYEGIMRGEVLR